MPGIFISYRRSDNPDAVGRIYDRLVTEFGKARVFKDVDSIPLGQDFRSHLNDIVGGCAAVLAIIGPRWVDIRNEVGDRRLEDPDDFVRIELEAALTRNVPVVPVLVGHAPMPGTSQLPSSLGSLAFRQSIEVRPDPDFHNDATRLVAALRSILDPDAPIVEVKTARQKSVRPARWMAGVVMATLVGALLAIPALKHLRETPPPELRIAIPLPVVEGNVSFALSPDSRQIVYVAKGDVQARLWLRSLSTTTAQPLPGTGGALAPFWSPDSRSIGFFAGGSLKLLELGSSQLQTLAGVAGSPTGAWGARGDILFNPGSYSGLSRVSARGGPVTVVTKLVGPEAGQRLHSFLPDGRNFIFAEVGGKAQGTYLGSLDGDPPVRLTDSIGPGSYLPSGWLLWVPLETGASINSGTLVAQRLNLRNTKLVGQPVTIAGGIFGVSASSTGLVAHLSSGVIAGQRQLTWVSRSGQELGTIGDADGTLDSPRVASDGRRVVVSRLGQGNRDIWLLDGERPSRMTLDAAEDAFPVWSPDDTRIAFTSNRSGKRVLFEKKLTSGAGGEELLLATDLDAYPSSWSADQRYLLYFGTTPTNDTELAALPMTGNRKAFKLLNTPFVEVWPQFSPNGRWVAYQSNESGQYEVFVRQFHPPGTAGETASDAADQWMVSTAGGVHPMWNANGNEIYFLNPAGEMMAVSITVEGSGIVAGTPARLFQARIWGGGVDNATGRQYDLTRDGRFLINRELEADATPTITLIQNWNADTGR